MPFIFENICLLHPKFRNFFSTWGEDCQENGWDGIKFIRKLKFVKSNLKGWNRITFGDLMKRKSGIILDIKDFIL